MTTAILIFFNIFVLSIAIPEFKCNVAILGGGIGGLYSAYQLYKQTSDLEICLFEKKNRFGGRIYDLQNDIDLDGIYIPLGGIKIDNMHSEAKEWFNELNIDIFWSEYKGQLVNTRSIFGRNSDDIKKAFPSLNPLTVDEDDMYSQFMGNAEWDYNIPKIISNSNDELFKQYNSMNDYLRSLFGPEGYQYLVDNFRFRADFIDNDIRSYIQFLHHEFEYTSFPPLVGYPVGGISAIIRKTLGLLNQSPKVHIFFDAQITAIYTQQSSTIRQKKPYPFYQHSNSENIVISIGPNKDKIITDFAIINIDPSSFKCITGNIADEIKQQQPFLDAKPIPVSIIMGIYENKWWENIIIDKIDNDNNNIRRIWTRDNCINFMEMPINPYQNTGNFGRARLVYSDGYCAQYWKTLFETKGKNIDKIQNEIQTSLQYLFGDNVVVPKAMNITYQYWKNAWHFQHPNALFDMYQLEDWALHPIQNRYDIALVNEAWNTNRGWIIGPIRSSQKALKYHFDLEFTDFWVDNSESLMRRRLKNEHRSVKQYGPTNR